MRLAWLLLALSLSLRAANFLIEPYLQFGDGSPLTLVLLWQATPDSSQWSVEVKTTGSWAKMSPPVSQPIAVAGIEPHLVWRSTLTGLIPGKDFDYRVLRNGEPAFNSHGRARKTADQPFRFVAFGDCAANTDGQRQVAAETLKQDPDFVFIPGDIVYTRGRISEYREKFFPIYSPLIAHTLFIAAPGNHDTQNRDLDSAPDAMAYFYYWAQPLNGPTHPSFETLKGNDSNLAAFRSAAGANYPRMLNFSFDYGNSHWVILDSNAYAEWTDASLRRWIAHDFASSKATWKFVGFHHPGFNSSKAHREDQWMRRLSDVFEAAHVDVVIAGHVHNYQRTYPLTFRADPPDKPMDKPGHLVNGAWNLDETFDGQKNTHPKGVIYLVTGAGGAGLYDPEQESDPKSWLDFTTRFHSTTHSYTLAEIDGRTARFRQISATGAPIDAFTITK
jgi:acid phosphatase type 7